MVRLCEPGYIDKTMPLRAQKLNAGKECLFNVHPCNTTIDNIESARVNNNSISDIIFIQFIFMQYYQSTI